MEKILKIFLISVNSILFIMLFLFVYYFYSLLSYSSFSISTIISILLSFVTLVSMMYAIIISKYVYRHLKSITDGSRITNSTLIKGLEPLGWFFITEGVLLIIMSVFTRNLVPSIIFLIGGTIMVLVFRNLKRLLKL
jgi:hypothetical protein